MTNQLFQEVLDGRIPLPAKPVPFKLSGEFGPIMFISPAQEWFLDFMTENRSFPQQRIIMGAEQSPESLGYSIDGVAFDDTRAPDFTIPTRSTYHAYYKTSAPMTDELRELIYGALTYEDGTGPEVPPTDPRERALWAKQHRGTGPVQEPMRHRGRINHYRQKG